MSKGLSYVYNGTKGQIVAIASSLPPNSDDLVKNGWEEISHPKQAANGSHTYQDSTTGLKIRYDEPTSGASGFAGKGHYHILNPNATSNKDMYLDKNGNPVAKGSKASHIMPKKEKKR